MRLDGPHFSESHFELAWPRSILADELGRLVRSADGATPSAMSWSGGDWHQECQLLIAEAFRDEEPSREFGQCTLGAIFGDEDSVDQLQWLSALLKHLHDLPEPAQRRPYWSQRRSGQSAQVKLGLADTTKQIQDVIDRFDDAGYLAQAFGQDCVDGNKIGTLGSEPSVELHRQLGRTNLWPLGRHSQHYDLDALCDVVEFLHDHISRPSFRWYHGYSNCGYHYSNFRQRTGRALYRWRINSVMEASQLNLTLNQHGRFEETEIGELEQLVDRLRVDEGAGAEQRDELLEAVDQFRRRGSSEGEKRAAIVTLAGILERRRSVIKDNLLKGDEGALFEIANKFDLRHRNAQQQADYDKDLYFQWIFYFYVSTIRLTDRLLERQKL